MTDDLTAGEKRTVVCVLALQKKNNKLHAEQVERRNALAEGAESRHDCLQSTQPKYTREQLIDIASGWADDDYSIQSPIAWAVDYLIEAGALQVKK